MAYGRDSLSYIRSPVWRALLSSPAWCFYLAAAVILLDQVSSWWLRVPLFIAAAIGYSAVWLLQTVKFLAAAIPLYFGTVRSMEDRLSVGKQAVLSFFLTVFTFAVDYVFISRGDEKAFNVPLDMLSALYFSIVTVATVGYGDIYPVDPATRLFVCAEIIVGMFFAIIFFALLVNIRVERRHGSEES
jgi:hypothetical protein